MKKTVWMEVVTITILLSKSSLHLSLSLCVMTFLKKYLVVKVGVVEFHVNCVLMLLCFLMMVSKVSWSCRFFISIYHD